MQRKKYAAVSRRQNKSPAVAEPRYIHITGGEKSLAKREVETRGQKGSVKKEGDRFHRHLPNAGLSHALTLAKKARLFACGYTTVHLFADKSTNYRSVDRKLNTTTPSVEGTPTSRTGLTLCRPFGRVPLRVPYISYRRRRIHGFFTGFVRETARYQGLAPLYLRVRLAMKELALVNSKEGCFREAE